MCDILDGANCTRSPVTCDQFVKMFCSPLAMCTVYCVLYFHTTYLYYCWLHQCKPADSEFIDSTYRFGTIHASHMCCDVPFTNQRCCNWPPMYCQWLWAQHVNPSFQWAWKNNEIQMQTARNRYFPRKSWELCTAYSKGGWGGGLEALARKFDPVSKSCFLHTSWKQLMNDWISTCL